MAGTCSTHKRTGARGARRAGAGRGRAKGGVDLHGEQGEAVVHSPTTHRTATPLQQLRV